MASAAHPALRSVTFSNLIALATAVRLGLVAWSDVQDATSEIKYTDVDYFVFTDGSREVLNGRSPFERATYRYTPLLAFLMIPNCWWPSFGKLIFALADIACGILCNSLLVDAGIPPSTRTLSVATFLLNPITATVSTRGSADGLVALCVLMSLWAANRGRWVSCGFSLGLAAHLKLYPLMYLLPLALNILLVRGEKGQHTEQKLARALALVATALGSFFALCYLCYAMYGQEYVQHALVYHLGRVDHRHNFSPAFYPLYLQDAEGLASGPLAILAFLPQMLCVVLLGILWCRTPARAMLFQTIAFVAMNKVITAQYFTWWMALLPLGLPYVHSYTAVGLAFLLWLVCEVGWGSQAYWLEIEGQHHFMPVTGAGAALMLASTTFLIVLF